MPWDHATALADTFGNYSKDFFRNSSRDAFRNYSKYFFLFQRCLWGNLKKTFRNFSKRSFEISPIIPPKISQEFIIFFFQKLLPGIIFRFFFLNLVLKFFQVFHHILHQNFSKNYIRSYFRISCLDCCRNFPMISFRIFSRSYSTNTFKYYFWNSYRYLIRNHCRYCFWKRAIDSSSLFCFLFF